MTSRTVTMNTSGARPAPTGSRPDNALKVPRLSPAGYLVPRRSGAPAMAPCGWPARLGLALSLRGPLQICPDYGHVQQRCPVRVTATEAAAITAIAVEGEVNWARVPASAAPTPCMVSMPEDCSPRA